MKVQQCPSADQYGLFPVSASMTLCSVSRLVVAELSHLLMMTVVEWRGMESWTVGKKMCNDLVS